MDMENQEIIDMLNKDRANELIAIMQYMNHHYTVSGQNFMQLQDKFKELGIVEMQHAEMLAERISLLGGNPVSRAQAIKDFTDLGVIEADNDYEMVQADLDYERLAINDYAAHIEAIGSTDPVTTRMLEDILAQEEEHANDLNSWLGKKEIPFRLEAVGE
jgi:bacterioferritin